jgi:AcrR family transcriptional regulator
MARPKRINQPNDLPEVIKETAWKQIAEFGAPTLSLRAIARELGITAPAIYNYFQRRDDLVTALIIDAYTSFGDWQINARDEIPAENLAGRLERIGLAYRQWALIYPQRYQLIFGTPIPGYEAPMERVMPSAARSLGVLLSIVEGLRLAGRLKVDNFPQALPGYEEAFTAWKEFGGEADILSLSISVLIWSHVHGLVSLEISKNAPPFGVSYDELYFYELKLLIQQFIRE